MHKNFRFSHFGLSYIEIDSTPSTRQKVIPRRLIEKLVQTSQAEGLQGHSKVSQRKSHNENCDVQKRFGEKAR